MNLRLLYIYEHPFQSFQNGYDLNIIRKSEFTSSKLKILMIFTIINIF